MPPDETLAARVARLVQTYGSDDKLAAAIGTTRQVVIGWRTGRHEPQKASREKLAQAEGVPAGEWHALARRSVTQAPVGELEAILERLLALSPQEQDLLRPAAAELANAIRQLSEKADQVADRLDALATPGNGHQSEGTSG